MEARSLFSDETGPLTVVHDIWVADIDLDAILGIDFLHKHGCELKLSDGRYHLCFPSGRIPCQDRRSSPVCRRVALNQTVVVHGSYSIQDLFFKDFSRTNPHFQGLIFHGDYTLTELPEIMNYNV